MQKKIYLLGAPEQISGALISFIQELGFSVSQGEHSSEEEPDLVFCWFQDAWAKGFDLESLWPNIPKLLVVTQAEQQLPVEGHVGVLVEPWGWTEVLVLLQQHLAWDPGIQSECQIGDWVDFSLASTRAIFQSMREFLRSLLAHSSLQPELIHSIHFAISEILINAMEHGNHFDSRKRVHGSYVLFQDRLVVKIEDQGSGFLLAEVPDPIEHPFDVAENRRRQGKRPGGYGLALARKWMDLTYSERGNVALLTRYF